MTQYSEPTPKARQIFFLVVLLAVALGWLTTRLNDLLPPLSDEPSELFDQVLERSLLAAVIGTIFFGILCSVAVYFTRRAVQSGQWPPKGMPVPFRTKVLKIKNPRKAWAYLAALLLIFSAQIAMPWYAYAKQRAYFGELKELIKDMPPNHC
jgi:hypothetical protein